MYTRCPSCRAEICFDPPANAASLPDGYRHKIRCPACGVTIGVKIPSVTALAQTQPTYIPQNQYASHPELIYSTEVKTEKADKHAGKVQKKVLGRARSFTVFIIGVLLLTCSILGFFGISSLSGLDAFDGLSLLTNFSTITSAFSSSIQDGLVTLLPVIFFVGACLTVLGSLCFFLAGKYSGARFLNFIWSVGFLVLSFCILFQGALYTASTISDLGSHVSDLIANGQGLILLPVILSAIYVVVSLVFMCKPMNKWVKVET